MEVLEGLNDEQKAAVTHGQGPLLIVAGAGTGKTTVITRRLAWLVQTKKAIPEEILVLTFTEKAAQEMEERVDVLLPYGYLDLWVSTFHAFGERILKLHGLDIGLPTNFKVLSETEQWMLLKRNFERLGLNYYKPLGNPTRFLHALVRHFSRAKDEAVTPEAYLKFAKEQNLNLDNDSASGQEAARLGELAESYHLYQQILREESSLDFGDLISETMRLFNERPALLTMYRAKFKYILVDEFQDTNWAQYQLIKLLAAPRNNLTVTGDDDQSIYKFRGASIANILSFKKDYPHAQETVLSRNYRSRQNILDLAYRFIQQNNPNRLEVQLKGELNKKLISHSSGEATIAHLYEATESQEARSVAEKIMQLREGKGGGNEWRDFAILLRANHEAQSFIQALESASIPYHFFASSGLFAKPIVLDILSFLKLLDNYHESSALYRVLSQAPWKIEALDISSLSAHAKRKARSLYDTIHTPTPTTQISGATRKTLEEFLELLERLTKLSREKGVARVLYSYLRDSGLLQTLTKDKSREGLDAIETLVKFFKFAETFERSSPEKTARAFVEATNLSLQAGDEGALAPIVEEGPEAVKILTVHSAKGLEFNHVFVVNLVDKRFPSVDRPDPIPLDDGLVKETIPQGDLHLEEERRLLYVAMTRAKESLFFTSAQDYGGARLKKPSRFLYELGLVSKEETKKKARPTGRVELIMEERPRPASSVPRDAHADTAPMRFSFTQLKAYETCPYQYRFAHILQIPVEGKASFSFGKTVHKTLELFFRQVVEMNSRDQGMLFGGSEKSGSSEYSENNTGAETQKVPAEGELLKIYEDNWIDDWYDSPEHQEEYKKKGREMLKDFYRAHQGRFPVPKRLEQKFNVKIGPHTLYGVVDRIDILPSGGAEIIDYKTGKAKDEKSLEPEDKDQLIIYQMAAQDLIHVAPELLSFYYLDGNRKVSFQGMESDIARLKEKIIRVIQNVQKRNFDATPDIWKCRSCDFNSICEFRKLS